MNINDEYFTILLLAIATFSIFLSTNLIKPVLPVLAESLGGEDLEIASIMMISIILLSLIQPFGGALADRYGYNKMIVIGGLIGAFSSLLCIFANNWNQLLILRGLGGLADAISGPAILAIVASISERRRGFVFGIFRSSQGLSFMIGPIIGAIIAKIFSLRTPFIFDFTLTILAILMFVLFFKGKINVNGEKFNFNGLKSVVHNVDLLKIAYLGFSEGFSFTIWISFLPVYMLSLFMSEIEIGLILSIEALAFSISNIIVGYLSDRVDQKILALIGAFMTSIISILYLFSYDLSSLIVLSIFYGFGCSIIFLLSTIMASYIIPSNLRATLLGAFDSIMDLGLAIGPIICWIILKVSGLSIKYAFLVMAISTFIAIPIISSVKLSKNNGEG